MIRLENKRHFVLMKDFDAFMYDHIVYRGKKRCRCYCRQAFSTEDCGIKNKIEKPLQSLIVQTDSVISERCNKFTTLY